METQKPEKAAAGKRNALVAAAMISAWLLLVVGGLALLNIWANLPGPVTSPPLDWPVESSISRSPNVPTLLVFGHPRCPCTRATLGELDRLLLQFHGQMAVHVVFVRPPGSAENWAETDLWRRASIMPGVTVHRDDGGQEARRFHSSTSGHILAYDEAGGLLFDGGITGSRGHSGDNPARSALEEILDGKRTGTVKKAVYGCPLFENNLPEGEAESQLEA